MRQLNEIETNLLLACAADGAVRVWRSYLHAGQQRMATAFQAVPIHQPPMPCIRPAAYALAPSLAALYAAGGSHPDVVSRWDMVTEMSSHSIGVRTSSAAAGAPAAVERLSTASEDPHLLLAACSDRMLRLYDIRAPSAAPALTMQAGRSAPVGLVYEPAGQVARAVLACADGDIHALDLRAAGGGEEPASAFAYASASSSSAELRSFRALGTSRDTPPGGGAGGPGPTSQPRAERLTALAAHPHARLLATGSSWQEVRVYMHDGTPVSTVRPRTDGRVGATTALAWHPYNVYLGVGGRDSTAWVFPYEGQPNTAATSEASAASLASSRALSAMSSRSSYAGSVA
jgi:WD40 repeat protein